MTSKAASNIDYEQCVTYYRAGRRIAGAAAIERYLAANPRIAERASRDANHDLALAHRYDAVLDEPIPPRLLNNRSAPPTARLASAAGLLAVIGLSATGGWWLHDMTVGASSPTFGQQVARLTDRQPTGRATSDAESRASRPALSQAGYQFSNQRVVAANNGQPLTAYDYRNAAGKRVTIYARPRPDANATQPDIMSAAGVSLARWHARGHDYALTGDLPPATLDQLAGVASSGPGPALSGNAATSSPAVDTPRQQTPAPESQPIEHTAAQSRPSSGL